MTYTELVAALHVFGFTERERLTMSQVRRRHRELIKAHHPDQHDGRLKNMQRINAAAAIVLEYLDSYHLSFSEEEFYRQHPEERLKMQFLDDPVWGGGR